MLEFFKLDEYQRNPVDIKNDIGPSITALPFNPKLGYGQIAVLGRIIKINYPHPLMLVPVP